ncbi:hypothetical protein Mapa_004312 [Marchantia paleacea]|nr:hypothetical protein Mapa_004312 [Marchantia paleacea]
MTIYKISLDLLLSMSCELRSEVGVVTQGIRNALVRRVALETSRWVSRRQQRLDFAVHFRTSSLIATFPQMATLPFCYLLHCCSS